MVLFQGESTTKQGSKSDSSKHSSQSQAHGELQNISEPFCPQATCIMATDKKPEEGQVSFGEPQSSYPKELFGATSTIMVQFEKGLKETQESKHNKSIKGRKEAIDQRQKSKEDTISVASKGSSTAADQDNEDAGINVDQETKQSIKAGPSPVIHKKLSTNPPSKPTAKTGPKPTKQGFLTKLSGGKRRSKKWDTRYFELTDTGHLNYYKKVDGSEPINSIYLKGCPVEIDPNDASMLIVKTEERDWKLKAANFEEACAWRDALLSHSEKN
ncbi:PREDICTED: uncharacterized protein LOC107335145 isoform X1 [Acropora digitifera]|uniref:uncharacterized protein LOC107335145 isoform X1 n=1 Tax=Acropora digitifera TaxID=70779 RepID=UPI00077A4D9B|nr:PREDICTED: uncharacterized protein LOC107335145 isoform X1 [Acropora digitifera]